MRYRLLKLLLFVSAFGWGISAIGILFPWSAVMIGLNGLGAGEIPQDPMLDYWLRMVAGAFTGIGVLFFILALNPIKFKNVIPFTAMFMILEGIIILVHGLRLKLPSFPFYGDMTFCLFIGIGIWLLRKEIPE